MKKWLRLGVVSSFYVATVLGAIGGVGEREKAPVVSLPEYHTVDLGFTTHWECDSSGRIIHVKVIEVRPGSSAWKDGLRKNDELKAIDHISVMGMRRNDYLALDEARLDVDHPRRTYTFVRTRRFIINRTSTLELTAELKSRPPSLPSQLPDPTPPSVPPSAGAGGTPPVAADHRECVSKTNMRSRMK